MDSLRRAVIVLLGVGLLAGLFVSLGGCGGSKSSSADREMEKALKEVDRALKDAWGP
jgi:hypothetical protein